MITGLLFYAEVHHLENAFVTHIGLVDALFFCVLLTVGKDVLSDFTEAFVPKLIDKLAEPVFGDVEILKMLVRVLDGLRFGVLREGKLLFTCLQDESTTA